MVDDHEEKGAPEAAEPEAEPVEAADVEAEAAEVEAAEEVVEEGEEVRIDTYGLLRLMMNMLAEQAWVELGLRLAPGGKELRTDLKQARLAIDTLSTLKEALGDNLLAEEKRELEQLLATLRLNFVQRS